MKPFLLITGMHRSGTSFLARALNLRGVYLGEYEDFISDQWRPSIDNLRGHWENRKFLKLAEQTLSLSNGNWDNIPAKIKVNSKLGNEIKKLSTNLIDNSAIASGIKDPRMLGCLDAWVKYLPKNFLVIGIFRNPLKVAESLKKRNGFTYEKSLNLWEQYNQRLLIYLEKFGGFLLNFDWPKKKLIGELDLISDKLGLVKKIDISTWYTPDLFISDKTYQKSYKLNNQINDLYRKLKQRSEQNKKIKTLFKISTKDRASVPQKLLHEIQNQGDYFKNVNEKNLKEISKVVNHISKLKQDIKNKESELTKNKDYISKLKHDIQNKEPELTKNTDYISKLKQDIKNKESELTKNKDYISKLKQDIKNKESELTKNKDYISKLKHDIQNKEPELTKNTDYISKLKQDIQNKESELTKNKDYISKLKQDIQNKEPELTKNKDYISKLKQDIQNKESELTKNTDYISKLKQDIQNKESEINNVKNFVSSLTKEISDKNKELHDLKNEYEKLEKNITQIYNAKPKYSSSRL